MSVVIHSCPDCGGDVIANQDGTSDWYHRPSCPMAKRIEQTVVEYEAWVVENGRAKSREAFEEFLEQRA